MTEKQALYLETLATRMRGGESIVVSSVCEAAGIALSTYTAWKKAHQQALSLGQESPHADFFVEVDETKKVIRAELSAERTLEPEIVEPEPADEEIPEVLVQFLSAYERTLSRREAFEEISSLGYQVSFDDILDALEGGNRAATKRYRQLGRRTLAEIEDSLRKRALAAGRAGDAALGLRILETENPEKWGKKTKVVVSHQLEEGDRKLIQDQEKWFKGVVKQIPVAAGQGGS